MAIDREHQDHRRKKILELLAERPIRRQMEIGNALRKAGFKVTQSTVSRDLEALGVVRQQGVYRPPEPGGNESAIVQVESFIRRVRSAGPYMLVCDTTAGAAKAVAWPSRAPPGPR